MQTRKKKTSLNSILVYNFPLNMAPFEMPFFKTKGQNLFDANKNDTLFTLCMGSDLDHLTYIKVFL